jgi:4'-phosphopantetheinyl transferase
MALLNIRQINQATYLGFWEITEDTTLLRDTLRELTQNQLELPEFASLTRQKQWLSSRILVYTLLQQFTPDFIPLSSNPEGKPIFPDEVYQVSITHSHQLVGVILSGQFKVGIDIEFISPKVLRVADKFMALPEKEAAAGDLIKILIYWSAKETLYKLYSKKKLIFKDHLRINPFTLQKAGIGTVNALVKTPETENTYIVYYETLNQYILTYCAGI